MLPPSFSICLGPSVLQQLLGAPLLCCLDIGVGGALFFQLERALHVEAAQREGDGSPALAELRRKFENDEKAYRRKLQAYQDGQQRQAQLVQKLQNKVGALPI